MIKLPEPMYANVGGEHLYTEAQFRQFRSDVYEDVAKVCEAKAAKWRKEASKHLPRHHSDCAARDLARAEICEADADAIRALIKEVE